MGLTGRMGGVFRGVLAMLFLLTLPLSPQFDKWKQENDRGNRYEGKIDRLAGSSDLEVLSFIGYREAISGYPDLNVSFLVGSEGTISVCATELLEQKQYWMESKPRPWKSGVWNQFGPWQTSVVLGREQIPLSNVGIVVRVETPGSQMMELAPAFLHLTRPPGPAQKYVMHLRSDKTLSYFEYSLSRVVAGKEIHLRTVPQPGLRIAKTPFPIEFDLTSVPEGQINVSLTGAVRNRSDKPSRKYFFYHVSGYGLSAPVTGAGRGSVVARQTDTRPQREPKPKR